MTLRGKFTSPRPLQPASKNATRPQPRPLGPTDLVNWPCHSPLTHRGGRDTLALHIERRHSETHKNTTQETHRETLSVQEHEVRSVPSENKEKL